ncbi:DUF3408 domain-containing protein [Dysgonomonas sp. GY75]|uniref:DUF3408 domain-containing protein n=1 Tax=Dysgonomonas sp. GY75 TaxID=2780419 RepID=UPI001883C5DF|nr:DUF3408 domain-containing protein [Dysgonomonas sp. GY75]MBF0647412.1 DUF3408 domain-containing protein [Dysgonomonas sp. GY75]
MKTIASYLLLLLRIPKGTHRAATLKHNDTGRDKSRKALRVKEKVSRSPEPEDMDRKGKKAKGDYYDTFLVQRRNIRHKQTSVLLGEEIYDSLKKTLRIAGDLTITGFVNNVLRHHFREYKEDINQLRRNFITDLSKEEEEEL